MVWGEHQDIVLVKQSSHTNIVCSISHVVLKMIISEFVRGEKKKSLYNLASNHPLYRYLCPEVSVSLWVTFSLKLKHWWSWITSIMRLVIACLCSHWGFTATSGKGYDTSHIFKIINEVLTWDKKLRWKYSRENQLEPQLKVIFKKVKFKQYIITQSSFLMQESQILCRGFLPPLIKSVHRAAYRF